MTKLRSLTTAKTIMVIIWSKQPCNNNEKIDFSKFNLIESIEGVQYT